MSSVERPLVAVVTPVYNGAKYLAETLACVQAQTYPNLVHIVLDNASVDETADIVLKAKAASSRVPLLAYRNEEVLPLPRNWDKAVRLSPEDAKYFRLLCADDLMNENSIARMVDVAEADAEVGLVGCRFAIGGSADEPNRLQAQGLPAEREIFDGKWTVKGYLAGAHEALSPTHTLIRRSLIEPDAQVYADGMMSTDTDACLRLMLNHRYGFVHDVIAWSREHPASNTSQNNTFLIVITEWLSWIDRYGPLVMNPEELEQCRRPYLRLHFRKLLISQISGGNSAAVERHKAFLDQHSARPTVLDYASAVLEWVWLRASNGRENTGKAPALWPKIWAELRQARHAMNT